VGSLKYVTYTKYNEEEDKYYYGRTMGYGTPEQIVAARDANHDYIKLGYGTAEVDVWAEATLPTPIVTRTRRIKRFVDVSRAELTPTAVRDPKWNYAEQDQRYRP
jgi:hypothetical protein